MSDVDNVHPKSIDAVQQDEIIVPQEDTDVQEIKSIGSKDDFKQVVPMDVAPATVVSRGTKRAFPATDDKNENVEEAATLLAKRTRKLPQRFLFSSKKKCIEDESNISIDVVHDKVIKKLLAKLKSDRRKYVLKPLISNFY